MNFSADIKHQFRHGSAIMKLLLVNVLLYLAQSVIYLIAYFSGFKEAFLNFVAKWFYASSDVNVLITKPWTIFTYMFLHDPTEIFHVISNMLYLYFFGRILVDFFQQKKVYPLYLAGGLVGVFAFILAYNIFPVLSPFVGIPMVGASAAIMAIVLAAATLVPEYSVFMIFIGPVKLKYIALVVIIIDMLSIPSEYNTGGHIAHLGGALTGFLYIRSYQKGRDWFSWWPRFEERLSGLFEKKKPKVVYRNQQAGPTSKKENDVNKQAKLDAILDKIKASGYDSLSKAEKEFLFKISNEK